MNKKVERRPYQQQAVKQCVNTLKRHRRAQCHMPPGSGKTLVSLLVKESLTPKITIFFVPTIQLIYQQYLEWAEFQTRQFDALVVTSGRIAPEDAARLDRLEQNHGGTTTNVWTVSQFLHGTNDRVIFSTYKSAPLVIRACDDHRIDLAIFDEAHHVAGGFDKRATQLLNDGNINVTNRMFVTATPKLNRDEEKALIYAGMDDELLFGPVAYRLSFREAVKKKMLCDYQLLVAAVTPHDLIDIDVGSTEDEKIALAAIRKLLNENAVHRGLTFHARITNATRFSKDLRKVLDDEVFVATVNKTHSSEARSNLIEGLRTSDKGVITNVRVLGEGFDFSALDFIVMVDPKKSTVELVQNIGRVMRKHRGKDVGTIILPIFVNDDNADIDAAIAVTNSRFMPVYRIATALGYLDTVLASEITAARSVDHFDDDSDLIFFERHLQVAGNNEISKHTIDTLSKKVRMFALYGSRGDIIDNAAQRLQEVLAFCEKHNRLPSAIKPSERELYQYFNNARHREYAPHLRTVVQYIDQTWGYDNKVIASWRARLNAIMEFGNKYGYLPTDKDSTSYFQTLIRVKKKDFPDGVEEELSDLIQAVQTIPAKSDLKAVELHKKLDELAAFIRAHNRIPTASMNKRLYRFAVSRYGKQTSPKTRDWINRVINESLKK